jgi:UDP-N-acetylglucosamine--N-acetylmuramyl-(pentapeptide) pyrophosphoryl-undecaprenol N-acetylglucosamine transferase
VGGIAACAKSEVGDTVRLLIAGGGSGGHVFPGLAVADALRRLAPGVRIDWLGARGAIEERLVPAAGLRLHLIRAGKLNRFVGRETLPDLLRVPVGMAQAVAVARRLQPDAVLTCGGFVAVPAGIAGMLCRRPILALQQDVEPNLANRLITPVAQRVVVAFAASLSRFPPGKAVALGNPIRTGLLDGATGSADRPFDLPSDLPLVLVTGGSQGALSLNRLVLATLPDLLERAAVVHLCGQRSVALVEATAATLPPRLARRYVWRAFVDSEMPQLLAAADLVVSRAGAATLCELAALGKAALLVPLPPAWGRSPQEINAEAFRRAGAADVLREANATAGLLWERTRALLDDPERRRALSRGAAALGRPHAADDVARLLLHMAKGR